MFDFLGIESFESKVELRALMTQERAHKLATALREFACFVPSREDVERAAAGQAIITGRYGFTRTSLSQIYGRGRSL